MKVIEATTATFENEVLKSDKPVLVDFNADWCGPCQMLKPTIEQLTDERDDVKFVSVNIDENARRAEINSYICILHE